MVSDREIQNIIRADRHRVDWTLLEGICLAAVSADHVLQFERARRETKNGLAIGIKQKNNRVGWIGKRHLCEVCLREDVDVPVGSKVVDARGRVDTAGGHFLDATVGACGKVPIGMEQVQVVAAYSKIDCVFDFGNLIAEEEVWRVEEGAVFAAIDPNGA